MTIPGVDATVALSIIAAVGDFSRFSRRTSWSATSGSTRASASPAASPPRTDGSPSRAARTPAGCWSRPPGSPQDAGAAARLLRARPRPPRDADRRRRDRPQAGRALLAPDHQGRGLRLRAPSLTAKKLRALELRAGMPSRRGQRAPPPPTPSKRSDGARSALAEQGERAYRQLVADWQAKAPAKSEQGVAATGARLLRPSSGNPARRGLSPDPALRSGVDPPHRADLAQIHARPSMTRGPRVFHPCCAGSEPGWAARRGGRWSGSQPALPARTRRRRGGSGPAHGPAPPARPGRPAGRGCGRRPASAWPPWRRRRRGAGRSHCRSLCSWQR